MNPFVASAVMSLCPNWDHWQRSSDLPGAATVLRSAAGFCSPNDYMHYPECAVRLDMTELCNAWQWQIRLGGEVRGKKPQTEKPSDPSNMSCSDAAAVFSPVGCTCYCAYSLRSKFRISFFFCFLILLSCLGSKLQTTLLQSRSATCILSSVLPQQGIRGLTLDLCLDLNGIIGFLLCDQLQTVAKGLSGS